MYRKYLRIVSFIALLLVYACNNKKIIINVSNNKNNSERIDTIYYKNGKIEQLLRANKLNNLLNGRCESYYASGVLKTVKFFYDDTAKGNSFQYYPNGILNKFIYLANNDFSLYEREYDSLGKIKKEKGTPFVGYDITEKPKDTLQIKLFLSSYGCKILGFEISPNGESYEKVLKLYNGAIEGTKVAKMWKPITGLKKISIYMKIQCTDSTNRHRIYFDTLTYKI